MWPELPLLCPGLTIADGTLPLDYQRILARMRNCSGTSQRRCHTPNICLFTSIRLPTDPEATSYLRDCLNSWRMAGFRCRRS